MTSQEHSFQEIMEGVEALQKQKPWLRQAVVVVLCITAAVLLMGQARQPRILEADKFVLKDPEGRIRAELLMERTGPALVLYGKEGRRLGHFGTEGTGAALSLVDANGQATATLAALPEGPYLLLFREGGKYPLDLGVNRAGPYFTLRDATGDVRVLLALRAEGGELPIEEKNQKSRATLLVSEDSSSLILSDNKGNRARLGP